MASEAMMRGLRALDAADDKRLSLNDFRLALKVTSRGRYLVVDRMKRDLLIVEVPTMGAPDITITFKGLRTLTPSKLGA